MESPFALTEHVTEGTGHFLFHTHAGMALVNAGVLLGIGYLAYKGGQALWHGMTGTRHDIAQTMAA